MHTKSDTHIYMYICIYIFIHTHTYVHMSVCVHVLWQTSAEGMNSLSEENTASQRLGNLLIDTDSTNDKSYDLGHAMEPF